MYYDPGIKLECLRTATSFHRKRKVEEAKSVSRGIKEHRGALRDGGDGGRMKPQLGVAAAGRPPVTILRRVGSQTAALCRDAATKRYDD